MIDDGSYPHSSKHRECIGRGLALQCGIGSDGKQAEKHDSISEEFAGAQTFSEEDDSRLFLISTSTEVIEQSRYEGTDNAQED